MKINKVIDEMIEELQACKPEVIKFKKKGNKAAGTRVRKIMQNLKNRAQDVRVEVLRIQKGE